MPWTSRVAPVILLAAAWLLGCSDDPPPPPRTDDTAATFVGRAACAECHPDQAENWRGSHHDLAMQEASEENVLGDFDRASFLHFGVTSEGGKRNITSTFSRRDGSFFVRTDGPDGELRDYRIAYTFGADPLQQYLVEAGNPGALQALSIAWDSRPEAAGGQRWFHLYEEPVGHDDPLHWTGLLQNWNYMCAGCHSTGLDKGYDAAANHFDTTWAEIDVSCEACHGPGSRHMAAARDGVRDGTGLIVDLRRTGRWTFADGATTAQLTGGAMAERPAMSAQTDACGRCHSRRTPVAPYEHGGDLHDAFSIALLEESLYHADGQIEDEVYVYGSFLQSKMHAAGVVCSDCHESHGAGLVVEGNALCTQCHSGAAYDVPEHHHHPVNVPPEGDRWGTTGTACVDCHMVARDYMVVDPRRDHSFRVPRPDLSVRLGTPNACTGCHGDRDDAWAAAVVADWGAEPSFHYGEALHAGRAWQADAEELLLRVIDDPAQPPIVRASALASIRPYLSPASFPAVAEALSDEHPLVRGGALTALENVELSVRQRLAGPLVDDTVGTVRTQAARLLAGAVADGAVATGDIVDPSALHAALDEYRASLTWRADRPDTYLHLGDLEAQLGDPDGAAAAYTQALEMLPSLAAAAVNLADVYRVTGRDEAGEKLLRQALDRCPEDAGLHQALGLTLIRLGRPNQALAALRQAHELDPKEPRYAYVYGIALNDLGDRDKGLRILTEALRRFPGQRELSAGHKALTGRRSAPTLPAVPAPEPRPELNSG